MTMKKRAAFLTAMMMLGMASMASGQEQLTLTRIGFNEFIFPDPGEMFLFELDSEDQSEFWMLQSSPDGQDWDDLSFLTARVGDRGFGVGIERAGIPSDRSDKAFFRALKVSRQDTLYQSYLNGLLRWRSAEVDDYSFLIRSSFGMTGYEAWYTVVDGEVASVVKVSSFPEFVEPPAELTIEDLFDKVGEAIEEKTEPIHLFRTMSK